MRVTSQKIIDKQFRAAIAEKERNFAFTTKLAAETPKLGIPLSHSLSRVHILMFAQFSFLLSLQFHIDSIVLRIWSFDFDSALWRKTIVIITTLLAQWANAKRALAFLPSHLFVNITFCVILSFSRSFEGLSLSLLLSSIIILIAHHTQIDLK
jgi:hypothetical protein